MIVTETEQCFYLTEQDQHARISGVLARSWDERFFIGTNRRKSVEFAIEQHDACWKKLDEEVFYDSKKQKPASFIEYPLNSKIFAYKSGVDHLEKEDKYAAYLVSRHYSSFFGGKLEVGRIFKEGEEKRQKSLEKELSITEENSHLAKFHFDLLQLCDNLSLYICMNEWGVDKGRELAWFKEGFPQRLSPLRNQTIQAYWKSIDTVILDPYPFAFKEVVLQIPYKVFQKSEIDRQDFPRQYKQTELKSHQVAFIPKKD